MKVAISTSGNDPSSSVDPHFGRCPRFLIVNTETMESEVVTNSAVGSAHGAGIAATQLVASKGVKAVLTGNVGPNAYSAARARPPWFSLRSVTAVADAASCALEGP